MKVGVPIEINLPLLNSQCENSLKKIEGKKWVCKSLLSRYFTERKTKQCICFAWLSVEHTQERFFLLIARQTKNPELKTLSTNVFCSSVITFSFYTRYCQELYWPSGWKWRQQTSGAKTQEDLCSIAVIWLIFVDNCKAVPSSLVNCLPTKNEIKRMDF